MSDMYLYDFKTHQHETFMEQITLVTEDGEAVDLTGKTARAQVRPHPGSSTLTATMSCSVTPKQGIIVFSLSESQTAEIAVGTYAYDVCIEEEGTGEGTVRQYLMGGKLFVMPSVTM